MKKFEQLHKEFNNITFLRLFEVEAELIGDVDIAYITFDIEITPTTLKATHIALTTAQEQSDKVAFTEIDLDECFSMDENLQALHDECLQNITEGDLYTLLD